jgi:hypothetical protein
MVAPAPPTRRQPWPPRRRHASRIRCHPLPAASVRPLSTDRRRGRRRQRPRHVPIPRRPRPPGPRVWTAADVTARPLVLHPRRRRRHLAFLTDRAWATQTATWAGAASAATPQGRLAPLHSLGPRPLLRLLRHRLRRRRQTGLGRRRSHLATGLPPPAQSSVLRRHRKSPPTADNPLGPPRHLLRRRHHNGHLGRRQAAGRPRCSHRTLTWLLIRRPRPSPPRLLTTSLATTCDRRESTLARASVRSFPGLRRPSRRSSCPQRTHLQCPGPCHRRRR